MFQVRVSGIYQKSVVLNCTLVYLMIMIAIQNLICDFILRIKNKHR